MISSELLLLISILKILHTSPEITQICENSSADLTVQKAFNESFNWDLLYRLVIRHRLWYRYYQWWMISHSTFSESVQQIHVQLKSFYQRDLQALIRITGETIRLARHFTEKKIEHCFVKGIVLNHLLYGALNTRPCRDIDLWVSMKDYFTAVHLLQSLGYEQKIPTYVLTGFKKKYHFNYRHDISFYHPHKKTLVELHFKLDYFGISFFPFSNTMISTVSIMNMPIQTLQHDYHLLYLIIHGAVHAWSRLRWLEDILLYIQSNQCDVFQVYQLSQRMGCEHLVQQTLLLLQDFFAWEDKKYQSLLVSATPHAHRIKKMAKTFITSDYEVTEKLSDLSMFIQYRLYLVKIAVKGKKIRALRADLFKIDEIFPYVNFSKPFTFMYYVIYPLWVIQMYWAQRKKVVK